MAYDVYMLASRPCGTLHVGVTGDLVRRAWEHRCGAVPGFTHRYGVERARWISSIAAAARSVPGSVQSLFG